MKQEEREMRIIELLHKIESKLDMLDEIVTLLRVGQAGAIEQTRNLLLESSPLRKMVYQLCDGKHTVSDIAKTLGKSMSSTSQVISKLLEARMITEERKGKEKYYRRLI
jgi:DNA-binding transcriptional ArsR family regulator